MPTNSAHSEVLKFAFPCTFVNDMGRIWIVAGEDVRISIDAPRTAEWVLPLLRSIDGAATIRTLIEERPAQFRKDAVELIARLKSERLLIDVSAPSSRSESEKFTLKILGSGAVFEKLRAAVRGREGERQLIVLCQADLNYQEARNFSRECQAADSPYAWISHGARTRAFVSPVFLPDSGPCLECLLDNFESLSPLPELYEALAGHAARNGEFAPVEIPAHTGEILGEILLEKIRLLETGSNAPAVFRLHVLEMANLGVETHRLLRDPACRSCSMRR
jgi:bacteriocin biosynthesis cyclodehydratase domain-containing protein